jgi:N-acetylglucosamine-6-phosphate deacetylase
VTSASLAITGARLVLADGVRPGGIVVRDGRIAALLDPDAAPPPDAELIDGGGRLLAPGLIDVHVHGGGGFSLMTDDAKQVRGFARWAVSCGVTGFLVSTSGRDHTEIVRRLRALAPLAGAREPGAARMLGVHLEGPYLNPARKGAFDPRWLRPPSVREYEELAAAAGGALRQMTVAPELPGGLDLVRAVVASGAVAAIGHTDATYDEARAAVEAGASHVTHCFNAMRPFGHRDPGVIGAILTSDALTAELIGDGAHVHYPAARVLLAAKGMRQLVLVTDGMPLAGTPDGEAEWEGVPIRVAGGTAVRASDGNIIGGVTTLDAMARNVARELGLREHEALAMASANAARAMRLADYGELRAGAAADFVLLDDGLRISETWVAGERCWARAGG